MKTFLVCVALLALNCVVEAKPVASVKDVHLVFDGGARGDSYFNSHLRSEMRRMGMRFVRSRKGADAILKSSGQGTDAGGFSGFASLTSPSGNTLWSAQVERAPRSRAMAFDSLATKLRVARR